MQQRDAFALPKGTRVWDSKARVFGKLGDLQGNIAMIFLDDGRFDVIDIELLELPSIEDGGVIYK